MNVRKRGSQRGAATVELALVAPILVVLVLWANYFWELQRVRLKAAEMVRFMAFERTVRKDPTGIDVEARARYQDLDGSTRTGALGTAFRNRLTFNVWVEDEPAPVSGMPISMQNRAQEGGASRFLTPAAKALGTNAEEVVRTMELNLDEGGVQATVDFSIKNGIIPDQIAFYTTGFGDKLDVHITEQFSLVHDTWRAWKPGDHPRDSYAAVEQHTYDRVKPIIDAGMKQQLGGALSALGSMASMFRLDNINDTSYIRESVKILPVGTATDHLAETATYTVPGNVLHAAYWQNDTEACFGTCEPRAIMQKRGLINLGVRGDNWPMRAYNCRGEFFQGATNSELPESMYGADNDGNNVGRGYHHYGGQACQ